MFDTMTLTKSVGSLCGALLVFLLGAWVAEALYSTGGGYGEDHVQGYVIDTGEGEEEEAVKDEGPGFAALYAVADASAGERVFRSCSACHKTEDGVNGVGPHLHAVVGRAVGSVDGFGYSGALSEVAEVWTPAELDAFLENPSAYAPGTSMGYAGLRKPEDRVNLIAYLDDTDGSRTEVAGEPGAEAAAAEGAAADEGTQEAAAAEDAADEGTQEAAAAEDAADEGEQEAAAAEDPADEGVAGDDMSEFAAMVASADAANGEKLFRRCAACHKLEDGRNAVGPHLWQVVGRDIASVDGFNYSDALTSLDGAWTADKLDGWLENPREFAPGNRMGYAGLKDMSDRADLVAYLQGIGN